MGHTTLRRMRKWVFFLSSIQVLVAIVQILKKGFDDVSCMGDRPVTSIIVIEVLIIFLFHIFSLKSKPHTGCTHKVVRTFVLVSLMGSLMFTLYLYLISMTNWSWKERAQNMQPSCVPSTWKDVVVMAHVQLIIGAIVSFFVLIEIAMTIAWGPLELAIPPKERGEGDVDEVSVVVVTPEMPQAYFPQMSQQRQPYQHDEFYPQQPIRHDNHSHFFYKIDESDQPQQPNTQSSQQYQHQSYLPSHQEQQQHQHYYQQQQQHNSVHAEPYNPSCRY